MKCAQKRIASSGTPLAVLLFIFLSLLSFHGRYVQHRMDDQRLLLRQLLLDRQACVFVAGNAKQMPDQVTQALRMALMNDDGSWTADKAQTYIADMIKQSRLQLETWS